jgi:hypothetical protein
VCRVSCVVCRVSCVVCRVSCVVCRVTDRSEPASCDRNQLPQQRVPYNIWARFRVLSVSGSNSGRRNIEGGRRVVDSRGFVESTTRSSVWRPSCSLPSEPSRDGQ